MKPVTEPHRLTRRREEPPPGRSISRQLVDPRLPPRTPGQTLAAGAMSSESTADSGPAASSSSKGRRLWAESLDGIRKHPYPVASAAGLCRCDALASCTREENMISLNIS